MFFTPNLVIGLTIMAVGVALLLDTLGIREIGSLMKYWPGLIVLFGASLVAQAFRRVDPAQAKRANGGVPCFFLFLLAVAMVWTFGLPGGIDASAAGRSISATGLMGKAETSAGTGVRRARVAAVMGRSTLDLRQVQLAPGEDIVVDVFVTMGRANVRIPDHWIVDWSALPIMGSLDEERILDGDGELAEAEPESVERSEKSPDGQPVRSDAAATPAPAPGPPAGAGPKPRLRLRGFVMMGKVEVTS